MDPIISQPEPRPDASGQKPQYQAPMPEIPAPQMEPLRKIFTPKFVALIIAIVLIGAGAYGAIWWWGNQNSNPPIGGAIPSATPDPTADWKTYTNTQYGFEFKYPPIWMIEENSKQVTLIIYGSRQDRGGGIFSDGARIIFSGSDYLSDDVTQRTVGWKNPKAPFSIYGFLGVIVYEDQKPEWNWGSWIKAYNLSPNGKIVELDWLSSNQSDSSDYDYQKYLLPVLSTFKFIP